MSDALDSNTNSSELESRLQVTEAQLKTITDERNSLQERLRKSNEENLRLANNIRVCLLMSLHLSV